MHKKFLLFLFFYGSLKIFITYSQPLSKGHSLIEFFYGYPNLFWKYYTNKGIIEVKNYKDLYIFNLGPLGARLEHLIDYNLGFGLEINYALTEAVWQEKTNPSVNDGLYNINSVYSLRYRIMFFSDYYFFYSLRIMTYARICLGFSSFEWEKNKRMIDGKFKNEYFRNKLPIGARISIGVRYFILEDFCLNTEVGLGGGPLLSVGFGLKPH